MEVRRWSRAEIAGEGLPCVAWSCGVVVAMLGGGDPGGVVGKFGVVSGKTDVRTVLRFAL